MMLKRNSGICNEGCSDVVILAEVLFLQGLGYGSQEILVANIELPGKT